MPISVLLIIILGTLVASGLFAAAEIALLGANRYKTEIDRNSGDRRAAILSAVFRNEPHYIGALLLGQIAAQMAYALAMVWLLGPWLLQHAGWPPALALVVAGMAALLLGLVLGEVLPKALATRNPDAVLRASAPVLPALGMVLGWPARILVATARLPLRLLLGHNARHARIEFSRQDLYQYLEENLAATDEEQQTTELDAEMFSNALELDSVRVRELMVPRTEMVAMEAAQPMAQLQELFLETELSRIVIYNENLDRVAGYVHVLSMANPPATIAQAVQPVFFVPESMPATMLLKEFNIRKLSMAIVLDEFGGTVGLLTVEDLVEAVLGDIEDEYDAGETGDGLLREALGGGAYRFSARLEVAELNEAFDLNLPEGDYNTLGGLIIHFAQHIPEEGEKLELPFGLVTIEAAEDNRITTVLIQLNK